MKLEQQVCSLELAKQLKELGFKQDSLFWWQDCGDGTVELMYGKTDSNFGIPVQYYYPAYTVAELGEMLPNGNYSFRYIGVEKWAAGNNLYNYNANMQGKMVKVTEKESKTEADARAKMLIYLKENKLID